MKTAEIKISINVEDPRQVQALLTLLTAIGFEGQGIPMGAKPEEKVKAKKSEEAKGPKVQPEAVEEKPNDLPEDKPETPSIKIEDLRAKTAELAKKGHTDVLKNKLKELGASSVSTLTFDNFKAYNYFLATLV